MTAIAVLRRRTDNLARRWLRTGRDHARAGAPFHQRSPTTTAISNENLNHQAGLRSPVGRVISRLEGLPVPALAPSTSAKSP
jgi:hypothetical protein